MSSKSKTVYPVKTEYSIIRNVPRELKFIFVSDLHGCPNGPVIDLIRSTPADAVLVGGDFVHNREMYASGIDFLREAVKLAPVFCSIGNHEKKCGFPVSPLVKDTHAVLLDDDFVEFGGIKIGGLTSGFKHDSKQGHLRGTPVPDLRWLEDFASRDGFKLLLCHHPEYYPEYIEKTSVDLTLSGHAHGGQWHFFGRGIFAPGQGILPRYTSGIHDGRLIISRGIGNPHIIPRINNTPEILYITITPENK